ncbi:MAG TPA: SDR family oxidoreductase [Planctomycetes bacterium]|nr:SDR family oxidoreductase [Planctomycetota bacterium]HIN80880.1 SDR family oxidoreductase [Planctomycetota bacterium]
MRRKRALITGASSGIGLAFAHHCARRGMDVVLVARRQERLRALAKELAEGHSITATVEVADLADPGAPAQIESSLAEAGLEIDTLINNAGYGLAGSFLLHKWEVHQRFLQVMLHSVCELTHRLLPAMIERGHGRVIIVSSVAGLLPGTAGHTLYAAVKAALNLFVESLALEQGRSDVHVTALCPGFTWSEFHDVNGTRERVSKLPRWMWLDAERVAGEGLAACERGDTYCIPGIVYRALSLLPRLIPFRLSQEISRRRGGAFRDPKGAISSGQKIPAGETDGNEEEGQK